MTNNRFKGALLALALPAVAIATPAVAAPAMHAVSPAHVAYELPVSAEIDAAHGRDRWRDDDHRDRYDRYRGGYGYRERDRDYGEPVYRDTRVWRGRDGRYYCRRDDGTTGLLIGAAVGGLIGNEIAGRGDRTIGAILGAAGGALLGRTIDRSNARCR